MVMKVLLDTKSIFYNLEINFKELNNDTASLTEGGKLHRHLQHIIKAHTPSLLYPLSKTLSNTQNIRQKLLRTFFPR